MAFGNVHIAACRGSDNLPFATAVLEDKTVFSDCGVVFLFPIASHSAPASSTTIVRIEFYAIAIFYHCAITQVPDELGACSLSSLLASDADDRAPRWVSTSRPLAS